MDIQQPRPILLNEPSARRRRIRQPASSTPAKPGHAGRRAPRRTSLVHAVLPRREKVAYIPIEQRAAALLRSAAALDREIAALPNPITLGHIAAACALGYLDFRLPGLDWRAGNAGLAAWYETFARRPAMAATRPDAAQA